MLRRSIAELCKADHHDDKQVVADWNASKTEAAWNAWIAREDATVIVAERAAQILGVGMVDDTGEILLNYVSPDGRFSGISKAIVAVLEVICRRNGNIACFLESTETAKRFYESCGYNAPQKSNLIYHKAL